MSSVFKIKMNSNTEDYVIVEKLGGGFCISHNLYCEDDEPYNAACDALTSLVLAQATAGIDYTTPAYTESLQSAFTAICELV